MESTNRIFAVVKKEIMLAFNTALGYTFILLFMFVESLLFFFGIGGNSFWDRKSSDLGFFFLLTPYLLLLFVSAIGMKIWAEEKESGTWEVLFTLPFKEWEVVLGKYIACCVIVFLALLSTLFIPLTTMIFGAPDIGILISGYLGVFFVGITFVSIILFFTLFFNTQIGTFLFGFFILSIFYSFGIQKLADFLGKNIYEWLSIFSLQSHFESFRLGILDPRDIYFYISVNFLFLTLASFQLRENR
ncbi:gliding motility ABC transporter [Leptospira ognonensis]|uniref:Gliding motility ABC transporter n=1 Tax=Leptospira ognonensis TaxID=2484945 RepID=A0A4R9K7C0_9LEPT|nr:ABC transporter permease subunit [Leptospira ognonensis]TGL62209.1 gliding motility ABC transporter [Leptospira ognonensis]